MGKQRVQPRRAASGSKPNLSALKAVSRPPIPSNQKFEPLPAPTGRPPFHVTLGDVLPRATVDSIVKANKLVMHCVGDTGGINQAEPQQIVANHMAADLGTGPGADVPAFFYHLGDVVYYYGEHQNYYPQFYEPYTQYSAPILPIPGNHDADIPPHINIKSLDAFVENFCAVSPVLTPEAGDSHRQAMTLPNVFWTLDTPFGWIVGVYTNVPDGGRIEADQLAWLTNEFRTAPKDQALIVALHHPLLSLDTHHSGSSYVHDALDAAAKNSGRVPDLVLNGHVHNYQRFTRNWNGRNVPVIVAGAGGYFNLHYMTHNLGWPIKLPFQIPAASANGMQATLEAFCDDHHGYMILQLQPGQISGTYFTVPRPQEPWRQTGQPFDSFTFNLKNGTLAANSSPRPASQGGVTGIGVSRHASGRAKTGIVSPPTPSGSSRRASKSSAGPRRAGSGRGKASTSRRNRPGRG